MAWALSRWTDGPLFDLTVRIVLGAAGDDLPADFAADRGRLYLGADWAEGLKRANAAIPHLASQMRGPLGWMNAQLSDGRAFLLGPDVGAIDAQVYHLIWFLRGRWSGGADFLSEFPFLETWEARVRQIGHGQMSLMAPDAAIAEAAAHDPVALRHDDTRDPQGLTPGMQVIIAPDLDGGEQPVACTLVAASGERIAVRLDDPDVGALHVHFPRIGYRVTVTG